MIEKYIKYIKSDAINPARFKTLQEYTDFCNIKSILSFDLLEMEITKKICLKKWGNYLDSLKYITFE